MAGTKRAAPSRSSSPELGFSKRARIDHNDGANAQGEQDEKAEKPQQKEIKKHVREARDHKELGVKDELGVDEEAEVEEDPELWATNITKQPEPVVTAHNSQDPSSGFSRAGIEENLPQTHSELLRVGEQDEKSKVDEVVIDRLEVAVSAPNAHNRSTNSHPKTEINKRARLELMVEIETEEESTLCNTTTTESAASAITSQNVAKGVPCNSHPSDEMAQEKIMVSIELEPVELASEVPLSTTPLDTSTRAIEAIDQDAIGTADSDTDGTNAPQRSVARERSPRSPTPSLDPRVELWKDETRSYAGRISIDREKETASRTAHAASQSPLFIKGIPQLIFFVDGSIEGLSSRRLDQGWKDGGYRVVFRDPFDDTARFVSQDKNPARFLKKSAIQWYQQDVDNDYVLEEGEVYDGPSRVVDFTVLCFGSRKVFSVPQAELAAIAQAQETAIHFIDKHQPPTSVVRIFSDALTVMRRIEKGIVPAAPKGCTLKFWPKISNPLLRAIIWQSHYLRDRGCKLEISWSPRCSALGPSLADAAANAWREWPERELSQRHLAMDARDGMLDKLNEETNELIRSG